MEWILYYFYFVKVKGRVYVKFMVTLFIGIVNVNLFIVIIVNLVIEVLNYY